MWQSPNQRVRAIANARKRERDRLMQPLHFRRVEGELKLLNDDKNPPLPVRVILNDLSPKGMGLFITENLISGQEVLITLKDPKALTVKARVIACQEYENNDSHILSPKTYPYRMGVRFIFESPEQETEVQAFCDEIKREYLYGAKAA